MAEYSSDESLSSDSSDDEQIEATLKKIQGSHPTA